MEIKKLTDELSVSGQIISEDLIQLQKAGVKSIICNRPDQEDPGQPDFDSLATEAKALGMEVKFMPVVSGQISKENAHEFGELTQALATPIHAYCRSGMRCTTLWALSELEKGGDRNRILANTEMAGYNLSKML